MKNIPIELSGYRLTVVEEPEVKQKRDGSGPVTDRQGALSWVVSLFVKRIPGEGQYVGKGEEIRVTLEADPGDSFAEGARVQLIDPRVSAWEMKDEETGRVSSGLSFRAMGLKPLTVPRPSPVPADR